MRRISFLTSMFVNSHKMFYVYTQEEFKVSFQCCGSSLGIGLKVNSVVLPIPYFLGR